MSHASDKISADIEAYLQEHERKDLLRFITCGSVDDGKSTLIGRLLFDSKLIYEDQLASITQASKTSGTTGDEVDLALLVDGLQSEREQGITIDVAYRFFSTDKRKFIIADTPGHEQYTRNMATGASSASLAIILIDARYGVQTQTRRHSFIADLLGIQHLVIAVNKMDLVDYSETRFNEIVAEYQEFANKLNAPDIRFVPMSALKGDNVVNRSPSLDWYTVDGEAGPSLLEVLETVELTHDQNLSDLRFPVQYVNRPNLDFRGYCGTGKFPLTKAMVKELEGYTVELKYKGPYETPRGGAQKKKEKKLCNDSDGAVSFHRDKNDCKRYFVCQGEHEHHKSCPDGLVFNEDEGVCDWPSAVEACAHLVGE